MSVLVVAGGGATDAGTDAGTSARPSRKRKCSHNETRGKPERAHRRRIKLERSEEILTLSDDMRDRTERAALQAQLAVQAFFTTCVQIYGIAEGVDPSRLDGRLGSAGCQVGSGTRDRHAAHYSNGEPYSRVLHLLASYLPNNSPTTAQEEFLVGQGVSPDTMRGIRAQQFESPELRRKFIEMRSPDRSDIHGTVGQQEVSGTQILDWETNLITEYCYIEKKLRESDAMKSLINEVMLKCIKPKDACESYVALYRQQIVESMERVFQRSLDEKSDHVAMRCGRVFEDLSAMFDNALMPPDEMIPPTPQQELLASRLRQRVQHKIIGPLNFGDAPVPTTATAS